MGALSPFTFIRLWKTFVCSFVTISIALTMAVYNLYSLLNLLLVVSPTLISEAAAGCGPGYYYNASGSVEIPFPQPPSSSPSDPSGNYSLFTHLTFPGPRGLNQSFGAVNASGYPLLDIPLDYQGCLFTWNGSPFPATQDHVNVPNNSSCQAALSQDCIDSIVESASGQANQLSRENQAGGGKCWIPSSSKCGKFVTVFSGKYITTTKVHCKRPADVNASFLQLAFFKHPKILCLNTRRTNQTAGRDSDTYRRLPATRTDISYPRISKNWTK